MDGWHPTPALVLLPFTVSISIYGLLKTTIIMLYSDFLQKEDVSFSLDIAKQLQVSTHSDFKSMKQINITWAAAW